MSVQFVNDGEILSQCKNRATQLSALDCPALVEYEFHHDELAVSTIDGCCINCSLSPCLCDTQPELSFRGSDSDRGNLLQRSAMP